MAKYTEADVRFWCEQLGTTKDKLFGYFVWTEDIEKARAVVPYIEDIEEVAESSMDYVYYSDRFEGIKFLIEFIPNYSPCISGVFYSSAVDGEMKYIDLLIDFIDEGELHSIFNSICVDGCIDAVKRIIDADKDICYNCAFLAACSNNRPDAAELLIPKLDIKNLSNAAIAECITATQRNDDNESVSILLRVVRMKNK